MADLKQAALRIFRETLAAIDIPLAMHRKLGRAGSRIFVNGAPIDLAAFERICTVAIGKASVAMARGLAELLSPDFRAEGIVVAPNAASGLPEGFREIVAGHPVPDQGASQPDARFWICSPPPINTLWFSFSYPAEARRWSSFRSIQASRSKTCRR